MSNNQSYDFGHMISIHTVGLLKKEAQESMHLDLSHKLELII